MLEPARAMVASRVRGVSSDAIATAGDFLLRMNSAGDVRSHPAAVAELTPAFIAGVVAGLGNILYRAPLVLFSNLLSDSDSRMLAVVLFDSGEESPRASAEAFAFELATTEWRRRLATTHRAPSNPTPSSPAVAGRIGGSGAVGVASGWWCVCVCVCSAP